MINETMTCHDVSQWLWRLDELLDEEVADMNRHRIETHCDACETCRQLWREERWLTAALVRGGEYLHAPTSLARSSTEANVSQRTGYNSSQWVAFAVLATALLLIATLPFVWSSRRSAGLPAAVSSNDPAEQPLGFIGRYPVITPASIRWPEQPLAPSNFLDIPAGVQCRVELHGCGTLHALGPAVFGLDRINEEWKVTMLDGRATVVVFPDRQVALANRLGLEWLGEGDFTVSTESRSIQCLATSLPTAVQDPVNESPGELLARGLAVFQPLDIRSLPDDRAWRMSAETLAKVIAHPDATDAQRNSAGFYRTASLSNAGLDREAIEAGLWWMDQYPGEDGEVVLHVMGSSHWNLGQHEKAREYWHKLLDANPDSPYRPLIEMKLAEPVNPDPTGAPANSASANQPPYTTEDVARTFVDGQRDGYLVVAVGLDTSNADHDGFRAVAERVRQFHQAEAYLFAGDDFESLKAKIAERRPRHVLFVIPPERLDVNFQRRVFLMSPTLDNDLMADFAWGYLTARDGQAVNQLWDRIEKLHQTGLTSRKWIETAVAGGGMQSTRYDDSIWVHPAKAGFEGSKLYFGIQTADPNVLIFADENLSLLESASVIGMSGNGDPQGIWLFDDHRNVDRAKHWQFDPAKVGHDPDGEMLRLKADRFRRLKLNSPILWSGTCHSGACRRVFVEADIVSTFGRSDRVELYELDPDDALALAWIDAGAAALLVPIGSNHGMAVMREQQFALAHGASLGETIKSTYDDVFIQARGLPALKIVSAGDSANFHEPIMQGGGANRILIGDPALRVFAPTPIPGETTTVSYDPQTEALKVNVVWEKGFHPTGWNMYGEDRSTMYQINSRLAVDPAWKSLATHGGGPPRVTAIVTDEEGNNIPCQPFCEWEDFGGKQFLHLQARIARDTNYTTGFITTFIINAP
ncbi:MAG TPA: hypothetical protein PKD54_09760 [Pirellulaceae bacterium]|nr:hypothetical protein [Pirellulaceae bacterium]